MEHEDRETLIVEQQKPLYDVNIEPEIIITDEMREYSANRTGKHIARVVAFGEELGFNFEQHDHTKFSAELIEPYILIDNSYRKDLNPPIPYTPEMADASFKHIKQEPHHPEHWDNTVIARNAEVDRDAPDIGTPINASEMSVPAICEMVCDWCAMSLELDSSPAEWATETIGTRWVFTDEQEELIFLLICMLWTPEVRQDVEMKVFDTEREDPIDLNTVVILKEEPEWKVIQS